MRQEQDLLGTITLEDNIYYGIATYRAVSNFSVSNDIVHLPLIYELTNIKKQAAITNGELQYLNQNIVDAIVFACDQILNHKYDDQFVVNPHQGGAGTSTNMNVNEVIANIALEYLSKPLGSYNIIHPINTVNLHQSTNDTYPTAVKITAIKKIREVAQAYTLLQKAFQDLENQAQGVLRLGRTQMMDAVPILAAQTFGAYAETVARDRWRIYKVEERLRTVNIGGTAIGTGLNAPLNYTFKITSKLQDSTNIGLARAESLVDNTQNLDQINEVSSLLKVGASSLIKIANDLRFLNSGPNGGIGEISLSNQQAGSTIMPGKVNPVIPEMVIQISSRVIANDSLINLLCSLGNLELNAFLPEIAHALFESLDLLTKGISIFTEKCIKTLKINTDVMNQNVEKSYALITPLIHILGYDQASEFVKMAEQQNKTIREILIEQKVFTKEELETRLNPYNITKPGIQKEGDNHE